MAFVARSFAAALILISGFLVAGPAAAQYDGPGLAACHAYAAQRTVLHRAISLLNDRDAIIERYTGKVGSQFVSSVLTGTAHLRFTIPGTGEVVYRRQRYLCLLADDSTPVFFHLTAEQSQ